MRDSFGHSRRVLKHGATAIRPVESRSDLAILFTTFPKTSESFLQRDVAAMHAAGLRPALYSLWGGGGEFGREPVGAFNKWRLVPLFLLIIPWFFITRFRLMRDLFAGVFGRRPPSWLNFWENMLGAGFAGVASWREFRGARPAFIHAAWAGAPATAAWVFWRIYGIPYSVGVHAYDLYEHGGDWWLMEKISHATFVHTSTGMARTELIRRGVTPGKIHCVRRGLAELPRLKEIRPDRSLLRIVCIARLVAKKGLRHQLRVYAAMKAAGIGFEARIVGGGPMHGELVELARTLGVADRVQFLGQLPHEDVWSQLSWADVLIHTGIVAESGDRDGLPNVIPEAMAAGTIVVSSAAAATTEAVTDGTTGLIVRGLDESAWVEALRRVAVDTPLSQSIRGGARRWVGENYDAHRNVGELMQLWRTELDRARGSRSGTGGPKPR